MKDKPLYVSLDPENYKKSKASMLNSQIDLLNSMKHLHTLKQIKDEKFKHKMRLYSLFSSLLSQVEKIEPKMPNVELPREKKVSQPKIPNLPTNQKPKPIQKFADPRRESIESELREVQEKLRRLNLR